MFILIFLAVCGIPAVLAASNLIVLDPSFMCLSGLFAFGAVIYGLFYMIGFNRPQPVLSNEPDYFEAGWNNNGKVIVRTSCHPHDPLMNNNELALQELGSRSYSYDGKETVFEITPRFDTSSCEPSDPKAIAALIEAQRTIRKTSGSVHDAMAYALYHEGNGNRALNQPDKYPIGERAEIWRESRGDREAPDNSNMSNEDYELPRLPERKTESSSLFGFLGCGTAVVMLILIILIATSL